MVDSHDEFSTKDMDPLWGVIQDLSPIPEDILQKQLAYLLRKYAAFRISRHLTPEEIKAKSNDDTLNFSASELLSDTFKPTTQKGQSTQVKYRIHETDTKSSILKNISELPNGVKIIATGIGRKHLYHSHIPNASTEPEPEVEKNQETTDHTYEWRIMETDDMLATSRPGLFVEYAGLAEYTKVIEQMLRRSIEKGWAQIDIWGYGANLVWMAANKINLQSGKKVIDIINYLPGDEDLPRFEKELISIAAIYGYQI